MTPDQKRQLQDQGYLILHGLIDPDWLSKLRTATAELLAREGAAAGSEFRKEQNADRLANLVDKGETFLRVIAHPAVLAGVEAVLGPDWKLGSLNYRAAQPYSDSSQPLHCDMGLVPDAAGNAVFNSIWLLDDFTPENGATRIVPGTHRSNLLPQQVLRNPAAPHPDEQLLLGKAGDVFLMNAHLWHGGTANHTAASRRSLHGFFVRGDQPQQQFQKRLLRQEVQTSLSALHRRILALDDPRNDELSRSGSGRSGFLK